MISTKAIHEKIPDEHKENASQPLAGFTQVDLGRGPELIALSHDETMCVLAVILQ